MPSPNRLMAIWRDSLCRANGCCGNRGYRITERDEAIVGIVEMDAGPHRAMHSADRRTGARQLPSVNGRVSERV